MLMKIFGCSGEEDDLPEVAQPRYLHDAFEYQFLGKTRAEHHRLVLDL